MLVVVINKSAILGKWVRNEWFFLQERVGMGAISVPRTGL